MAKTHCGVKCRELIVAEPGSQRRTAGHVGDVRLFLPSTDELNPYAIQGECPWA